MARAVERDHLIDGDAFWIQFEPAIACDGVEPLGTDEITLADIEPYQRFGADWVSFEDDTPTTPTTADMTFPLSSSGHARSSGGAFNTLRRDGTRDGTAS